MDKEGSKMEKVYKMNLTYLKEIQKKIVNEKKNISENPVKADYIEYLSESLKRLEFYRKGYCRKKEPQLYAWQLSKELEMLCQTFSASISIFYERIIDSILSSTSIKEIEYPKEEKEPTTSSLQKSITFFQTIDPAFYNKLLALQKDPSGFITIRPSKKDTKYFSYFPCATFSMPYVRYPFIHLTTEKSTSFFELKTVHELQHAIDYMYITGELSGNVLGESNAIFVEFLYGKEKVLQNSDLSFLFIERIDTIVNKCIHLEKLFSLLRTYRNRHFIYTIEDLKNFCLKENISYTDMIQSIVDGTFYSDITYIMSYLKALEMDPKNPSSEIQKNISLFPKEVGYYKSHNLYYYGLDTTQKVGLEKHKVLCREIKR